jgi:hypothetical protein
VSTARIAVVAELYGSLVTAFTDYSLSLSEQLTLLSKYAHLGAHCFRQHRGRFMHTELYADSMTCVKNAYYCVAKQQLLDPKEEFFLFQLGSDEIEKLFAGARMAGGHNPNFNLKELARLLSSGMDIMRVFAEHPDWYLAHSRMSTERGEKPDHLSPKDWRGDAVSGHVELTAVWKAGLTAALETIRRHLGTHVEAASFWQTPAGKADLLRPCGGNSYPGVKFQKRRAAGRVQSCSEPEAAAPAPAASVPLAAGSSAETPGTSGAPSSDIPDFIRPFLAATDDDDFEDVSGASGPQPGSDPVAPTPGKGRAQCLWVYNKWVHIESLFRLLFNETGSVKQSKERLRRVRTFQPLTVASHLRVLSEDAFNTGDCVATLVRCSQGAYLAIVQATHLFQAGQQVFSVRRSELSVPQSRIELRGQVLRFLPHTDNGLSRWDWDGSIVRLRPLKAATANAPDMFDIRVSGSTAVPIDIPKPDTDSTVSEAQLNTWKIVQGQLEALRERCWTLASRNDSVSKFAACATSAGFPYRSQDGESTASPQYSSVR